MSKGKDKQAKRSRATLEAQKRFEAEFVLAVCAMQPQRCSVAIAQGVTAGMLPARLQLWWEELVRQGQAGNEDLDITAMRAWLEDRDPVQVDSVRQFLAHAPAVNGDGIYLAEHARRLVEAHARLELVEAHTGQVSAQEVGDEDAYRSACEKASSAAERLAKLRERPRTWVDDVYEAVESALEPQVEDRITTGFTFLDEHFGGGALPGWLIIVLGGAKAGKTALAVNGLARCAAKSGKRTLVVSLEMSPRENIKRFLASESSVPVRAQNAGDLTHHQRDALIEQGDQIARWSMKIRQGLGTVDEIAAAARTEHKENGLDMLVVDYLQLVSNGLENRALDLERTTRGLKLLAGELEILVVLLSQPNNADAKSENVGLFSGKGSGSIAADCDAMLVPLRDSDDPSRAGLDLVGFRHGEPRKWPLGFLRFNGARMRFEVA